MNPALVDLDIVAATHATRAAILGRQSARWQRLLEVAAAHSAFYRRHLAGRDLARTRPQDLQAIDKTTLMRHFDGWVTDPALDLAALRSFVADDHRIGEPYLDRYAVWESSGSTGEPAIFVQDAQALAVYDTLEGLRRSSPRPWQRLMDPLYLGERVAFVGVIDGHFASEVTMRRLRRAQPWRASSWRSFSLMQRPEVLGAELEDFAPTIVATYPSAAMLLAAQARAGRLRLRPQEVWTGGETLTGPMRESIEQALGCTVRNSYGASEFLPIAWECTHGQLHVNADWVLLEPVDARHRPVPPGTPSHTTLLSNLANHVQPIIRLDIGDRITLHETPCGCGSALPVIEVEGRSDDVLTLAGADGAPVTLLPLALVTVLEDEAGVCHFQLAQTAAHTLRLRLGRDASDTQVRACRLALHAYARSQGVGALRIEVARGAMPAPGRSGKRARIVAREGAAAKAPKAAGRRSPGRARGRLRDRA